MKRLRFLALLLLLVLTGPLALASAHEYQPGRLVDATTQDREKKGNTRTRAIYTVESGGIVYTVRGGNVGARAKDYTKGMIVGDPVDVRVDGEHVYLRTPKGKEIKTDILKRARSGS